MCAVSGKRRGKGSSREQSPYAEMCAGIELVIAENIERIYKQNCQNLGLLTSTELFADRQNSRRGRDSAERIHRGRGRDHAAGDRVRRAVSVQCGAHAGEGVPAADSSAGERPPTADDHRREDLRAPHAERERAKSASQAVKPGDTGFARADLRFSHEYVTPMAAIFFEHYVGKDAKVNDPSSILFFRDHLTFLDEVISEEKKKMGLLDLATQLKLKQQDFAKKQGIRCTAN